MKLFSPLWASTGSAALLDHTLLALQRAHSTLWLGEFHMICKLRRIEFHMWFKLYVSWGVSHYMWLGEFQINVIDSNCESYKILVWFSFVTKFLGQYGIVALHTLPDLTTNYTNTTPFSLKAPDFSRLLNFLKLSRNEIYCDSDFVVGVICCRLDPVHG